MKAFVTAEKSSFAPVLLGPVADYCLSLMARSGIDRVEVPPCLQGAYRSRYGAHAFGMILSYDAFSPVAEKGPVLVMRGDLLCDFDLKGAISFHEKESPYATVILSRALPPHAPSRGALPVLARSGCYLLSPSALQEEGYEPEEKAVSRWLEKGYSVFGYKDRGYRLCRAEPF